MSLPRAGEGGVALEALSLDKDETYRSLTGRLGLLQKMLGHVDEQSMTGRDTRVNAESLFALQRLLKEALGEIREEGDRLRANLLKRESEITYERGLKGHFQHENS